MIGTQTISVKLLPKIGDREDFSIRLIGPGNTDYTFPLSLTGTILAIWDENPKEAAVFLTKCIFSVIGTASVPPSEGFWFDSFNSETTLKETANKIRNYGINSFTKSIAKSAFVQLLGEIFFKQKEELNQFFVSKYGYEFFRSFDDAFEDSQAIEDLSTPPIDNAHFLYRVCILSGIIDHINIRLLDEKSEVLSLQALKNWLIQNVGIEKTLELTLSFQMIKNLRKQYPIHEHYTINPQGIRKIRAELVEAKKYFDITPDLSRSWLNVFEKFSKSMEAIKKELS